MKPLSTEGQGIAGYNTKEYSLTQLALPFGGGIKYSITDNFRIGLEVGMRKLFTDYLDDVSSTYAPDAFQSSVNGIPPAAMLLSDRSYETGPPIGVKGRQRGNSSQKDAYVIALVGVSFNMSSYRCPTFK